MKKDIKFRITLLIFPAILIIWIILFGSFYTYWNTASPEKTCASCHEIGRYVFTQTQSSHRNLHCKECHGTALSNGFHTLKEKGMMVVNHFKDNNREHIRMSEVQLLEVLNNCKRCHSSEYANWISGGHSVPYKDIFLNSKHNSTEQINFDCLRCHGMFFEGTVGKVVEPLNTNGPWKLIDEKMTERPTIPCMACHQIHQNGFISAEPDYTNPKAIFYNGINEFSKLGFYDRREKRHFSVNQLPQLKLMEGGRDVNVSEDPLMRNCIQCHAPDARHQAGTGDDRTPRGVHEGLSCIACHESHSNNSKKSCAKCHPAISNCKFDVTKMNTSYADAKSPNNIHFVACSDCHEEEKRRIVSTTNRN